MNRCPGCQLTMPAGTGVYGGSYWASPECWSVYGEVLAREFEDAVLFGQVHQLTVDAYAVQHAGGPHPAKSVCIHLVGLHLALECSIQSRQVPSRLQRLAATSSVWPELPLPEARSTLNVYDVAVARDSREHAARARQWAEQVWKAWSPHHAVVRELARACREATP